MLTHELVKMLTCLINVFLACGVKLEFELGGLWKIGPGQARPMRTKIDFVMGKRSKDKFIQAKRGRAIHARVLPNKP
jgi:hypothetical protein